MRCRWWANAVAETHHDLSFPLPPLPFSCPRPTQSATVPGRGRRADDAILLPPPSLIPPPGVTPRSILWRHNRLASVENPELASDRPPGITSVTESVQPYLERSIDEMEPALALLQNAVATSSALNFEPSGRALLAVAAASPDGLTSKTPIVVSGGGGGERPDGGGGSGDRDGATRVVYPRLDAPESVEPEVEFRVTFGISSTQTPELTGTEFFEVPTSLVHLQMKFIADGFTIVDGVKDVIVPVGPGQQYPTVTVTLRAQRDAQLDAQRTLTVMYLVGNDFRGEVSRTVTVVEGGVLPADDGQEANPTGNTGSSTSIDVRPDPLEPGATLTLRLLKCPPRSGSVDVVVPLGSTCRPCPLDEQLRPHPQTPPTLHTTTPSPFFPTTSAQRSRTRFGRSSSWHSRPATTSTDIRHRFS